MRTSEDIRLTDPALLGRAVALAFAKFHPRSLATNPVMLTTAAVSVVATILAAIEIGHGGPHGPVMGQICLWLWATVLFGNIAEALAEGRGRARADSLRATQSETRARLLTGPAVPPSGRTHDWREVSSRDLGVDDLVLVRVGDLVPADGEVVAGIASIDESAITGESAPVIRESGGDRSAVTGGTRVVSDQIVMRVTRQPGDSFLDRMIGLVEGARRRKTPNEIALTILLVSLTLIFLLVVVALEAFASWSGTLIPVGFLIALLVTLIPTTISALLSAIGIAGMDRLVRAGVIARSGRAVEAAGDVDVLLLDKTGTITFGNRMADAFLPAPGVSEGALAEAAALASLGDETPEGRSILDLATRRFGFAADRDGEGRALGVSRMVPFSAQTRISGVDLADGRVIRKGAADAILRHVPGGAPAALAQAVDQVARGGGTPLVVTDGDRPLGVIHLKDIIKPGIRDRFAELRRMGIRTVMVTGDNPLTAAAIAAEAGVDDVLAEATPERKLELIRAEQAEGRMVAMCGDGTNDAPALAQADVGVAMNEGTAAAKEAANLIDLDSDPTKLIEVVMVGKQLLVSRGALTTFSIANDVAKYFAIVPALFAGVYPALGALDIMDLASPESAILSAVIFNALVILALVPLALRGVAARAASAAALLRRNLLIYGLGGLVAPFIGIKLIDLAITGLGLV
ncbi:potassium-transporting ATPase subunit KdpB [Tistrella bauzanensis]|uniref:potassium-transporting ATPase subunit KdpB n=1 Tax=Tistrella TaxID=171436 RepID=UPI0031F63D8B